MELGQAQANSWYTIRSVGSDQKDLESRLLSFGFIPGERVMIKRFAPLFRDPLLVQIGSAQLALTKAEANIIQVFELDV